MTKPTKGSYTKKAIMTGAAIISLSAGIADDAIAASGSGDMQAILLTPIVVDGTQSLHFGSFTVNPVGTGGEVTVSSLGVRSTTALPTALTLVGGAGLERADVVSVTGANALTIDLIIPPGVAADTRNAIAITDGYAIANIATPTQTMVVGNFILGVTATGFGIGDDIDIVLTAGADTFALGATLLVKNTNTVGTYTGTYDITANYQ